MGLACRGRSVGARGGWAWLVGEGWVGKGLDRHGKGSRFGMMRWGQRRVVGEDRVGVDRDG